MDENPYRSPQTSTKATNNRRWESSVAFVTLWLFSWMVAFAMPAACSYIMLWITGDRALALTAATNSIPGAIFVGILGTFAAHRVAGPRLEVRGQRRRAFMERLNRQFEDDA